MNQKTLAQKLYSTEPAGLLSCSNKVYASFVKGLFELQLRSDCADNDVTGTLANARERNVTMESFVLAKQNGVVSGLEEVCWFLNQHSPIKAQALVNDGARVKSGTKILTLTGKIQNLVAYERTVLNVLGHMCGIATYTQSLVGKYSVNGPLLACTRKTRLGLLDKKACLLGGGGAHRLNLADAVLIKHNHLHAASGDFESTLTRARAPMEKLKNIRFFEVEVTTPEQFFAALKMFEEDSRSKTPTVIMLDNFSALNAKKLIAKANELYKKRTTLIECSGGITQKNLSSYIKTGADVLSMGSLTYSAPFFDVSMRLDVLHSQ